MSCNAIRLKNVYILLQEQTCSLQIACTPRRNLALTSQAQC